MENKSGIKPENKDLEGKVIPMWSEMAERADEMNKSGLDKEIYDFVDMVQSQLMGRNLAVKIIRKLIAQAVQEALAKQKEEIANKYGLANMDKFDVRDFNTSITYRGEDIFDDLSGFNEVEDGDWYTIITYKPKVIKESALDHLEGEK